MSVKKASGCLQVSMPAVTNAVTCVLEVLCLIRASGDILVPVLSDVFEAKVCLCGRCAYCLIV